MISNAETIALLRNRIANLDTEQRALLRSQIEARGMSWHDVAPEGDDAGVGAGRLPLTSSQMHFWLQQKIFPESSAYVIPFRWHIDGPLDHDTILRTLRILVARHEPLRTAFPLEEGRPWQQVLGDMEPELAVSDCRNMSAADCDEAIGRIARTAFDLSKAPLMRTHLLQVGENEHILVFVFHHTVADGWSRGILMREFSLCYDAVANNREPVLDTLPRSYGDFVRSRQNWSGTKDYERQKQYWINRLQNLEPQEFPADYPRHETADMASETLVKEISQDLMAEVSGLAVKLGTTTFVVFAAVFQLLHHRYTGRRDLAVCVPVAGRVDPDMAGLIGLFTNTIVLRNDLSPAMSFRDWTRRVQEDFANALEHQDYPFAELMDVLGSNREGVENSPFQISFQVQTQGYRQQNAQAFDLGNASLRVRQEGIPVAEAKLDMSWMIMERALGALVTVEYRSGRFEAVRMKRQLEHFENLLRSVVASPDALLPTFDYISAGERESLLSSGALVARPLPVKGVHDLISGAARLHSENIAIECIDRSWTYSQLEEASNNLARALLTLERPVKPGMRVAVSLPGQASGIISFLAIIKAGAVYVPIDPRHPADRIGYVLEDAAAVLVLTDDAGLFPGITCIDPVHHLENQPDTALPAMPDNSDIYILYTSGSTGRPKGVPITHRGLLNQFQSMARQPGIRAGDRMLSVTTPAFDISVLEMLWPLSVGATAVMREPDLLLQPEKLGRTLDEHDISHFQATPATWRMLLDSGWKGRKSLTGLCGGEALDAQLAGRLIHRIGSLWNVYGPTETTIWAGALLVEEAHSKSGKVPIGGRLDNTSFLVLDAYMDPVPEGVPGELHIGGISLSRGYWNRPALAAEKFVPDPYDRSSTPGSRLYKTGDLVVRRPDGNLEFVGRTDFQIKLRGYRIEVGEIESLLQEEEGVDQVLVLLDANREQLLAYVLLEDRSGNVDKGAMGIRFNRALSARLPRYMVPSHFILLEEFPMNANGKVDRKRLPLPDRSERAASEISSPANSMEQALHALWQKMLKREDIGVNDNFFELGGDSLLIVAMPARVHDALGIELEVTDFFRFPTLETLAGHIMDLQQGKSTPSESARGRSDTRVQGRERQLQRRIRSGNFT